jgi:hypothetical protein
MCIIINQYASSLRREEDLRKAIALSEEEEAKRRKAKEDELAKQLFDDTPAQPYVYQLVRRDSIMTFHGYQ